MSQVMHQQALCLVIEKAINKTLSLNVHGLMDLYPLEQKTLTVQLAEFSFPISFSIDNKVMFVTTLTERSDCSLNTSIASLIDLQQKQNITEQIKADKLDISGDIKVAQQFAVIFERLTIDWQSELASHIGDIPTYKVTQFSLWLKEKLSFAASQIQADASEWVVHEKRLVVTSSQLLNFNQQVQDVACEVTALEERLQQLSEQFSLSSTMQES